MLVQESLQKVQVAIQKKMEELEDRISLTNQHFESLKTAFKGLVMTLSKKDFDARDNFLWGIVYENKDILMNFVVEKNQNHIRIDEIPQQQEEQKVE